MQQILTLQAKEGMVLAKDVLDGEGRVLCGKGTELTAALIGRFERMEIVKITVEGHPVAEPGEKSLKEQLRDVEARFANVTKIPPLMYIKKKIMKKMIDSRGQ